MPSSLEEEQPVDSVLADVVATLSRSKHYRSNPPIAANIDLLEGKWRATHERIFARADASLPDSVLLRCPHAIVQGFGCVMLADGAVLEDTLPNGGEVPPRSPPVHHHSGPVALLRKPGDANYGHWIIELLPRILEFQRHLPGVKLRFAIPANPYAMRDLRLASLAWFGIGPHDVIWLTTEATLFDELYVIGSNSIHSHTHDAEGVNATVALAHRSVAIAAPHRRLYLRRPEGHKRALTNEAALMEIVAARGFEIIRPEEMSLAEQVRTFAEARIVAGVSGAALSNIVWATPPCQLISLSPNEGSEFFFWDLCNIRGFHFSALFGPVVGESRLGHSSFSIDPALFAAAIDDAVQAAGFRWPTAPAAD